MDLKGVAGDYDQLLADLVKASTAMDITHAGDCLSGKGLGFYVPATRGYNAVHTIHMLQLLDQ